MRRLVAAVLVAFLSACATMHGPQTITRHGRPAAVVVSVEDWECKTKRRTNLAEFFAESPLRDSGIAVERARYRERDVEL